MEGDKYLGFFPFADTDDSAVCRASVARRLAVSIISYFEEHGIMITELIVVGCDGTVLNTGWKVMNSKQFLTLKIFHPMI
jgi:hypothetical protein